MNKDIKNEMGVGIFFLVLAIAYMIGSITISTFTPFGNRGLDSRSIPMLLGILTIILSITHIVQVYLKDKKIKKLQIENHEDKEEICDPSEVSSVEPPDRSIIYHIEKLIPVKLILSFIYLITYIALYQPLGFTLSSALFLIAESILLTNKKERKKWYLFIILFSIGVSILIFFIFTKYLALFLPSGILG